MKWKYIPQTNVALRPFTYSSCNNFLPLLHLNHLHYCCLLVVSSHLVRLRSCGWNCVVCLLWSYSEVVSSMVDCYMGTSFNEMIQRLFILHHFSSSSSLLLFVRSSRLRPRGWVCFVWLLWPVSCFSTSLLSIITSCVSKHIRRSRHCWLCVPTIPAVAVDCCVSVLHCWQYIPSLSLFSLSLFSLSLIRGTVTCSQLTVPLHLPSNIWWFTLSFGWWVDYPTLQRFRDIYHYILLLVLRPAGESVAGASFYLPSNQ